MKRPKVDKDDPRLTRPAGLNEQPQLLIGSSSFTTYHHGDPDEKAIKNDLRVLKFDNLKIIKPIGQSVKSTFGGQETASLLPFFKTSLGQRTITLVNGFWDTLLQWIDYNYWQ